MLHVDLAQCRVDATERDLLEPLMLVRVKKVLTAVGALLSSTSLGSSAVNVSMSTAVVVASPSSPFQVQ